MSALFFNSIIKQQYIVGHFVCILAYMFLSCCFIILRFYAAEKLLFMSLNEDDCYQHKKIKEELKKTEYIINAFIMQCNK